MRSMVTIVHGVLQFILLVRRFDLYKFRKINHKLIKVMKTVILLITL